MKKYLKARPQITREITEICKREIDRQNIEPDLFTTNQMEQYRKILEEIYSHEIPKKFVLKKLPKHLGSGIFLHPQAKPMKKGDIIGSYSGEVSLAPQNIYEEEGSYVFSPLTDLLLTKDEQKTYDPKRKFHPRRKYYLKIDAAKDGNFTRFINHSYKPNVKAQLTHIKGHGLEESFCEVVYMAKRNIHPGEQLLVSYEDGEDSYWKAMGIEPFPMTSKTFQINDELELIQTKN